jgi:hypothetical protein
MALIKCEECGNEVSTQAKTCPKCGAKVKPPASTLSKLIVVLIGVAVVGSIVTAEPETTPPPDTPEQIAEKAASDKRFHLAAGLVSTIKDAVADPDSLAIDQLRVNDDASIVCAEYRARNGFGGMVREHLVVTGQGAQQEAAAWNKHCVQPMHDMGYVARAVLKN